MTVWTGDRFANPDKRSANFRWPSPVPAPGTRPAALRAPAAGGPARTGRPGAGRPVAGESVPRRLPRLPGACRAAARATARPPGSAPSRAHRTGSACPPRTRPPARSPPGNGRNRVHVQDQDAPGPPGPRRAWKATV